MLLSRCPHPGSCLALSSGGLQNRSRNDDDTCDRELDQFMNQKLLRFVTTGILPLFFVSAVVAFAQSLDPKSPTPLAPGENRGTLDSMVGPQYWSFKYKKGPGNIALRLTSMGVLGNPMPTTIQIILHGANGQFLESRSLTSRGSVAELKLPGTFT